MATISFDLTGLPPSANKRLHHMARYRSNQEWSLWTTRSAQDAVNRGHFDGLPWPRVHVRYLFHYPRVTLADVDNLIGSCKPILDGLVGIAIEKDDSRHVHELSASVEVAKGRMAGVTVYVEQCACDVQTAEIPES